MDSKASMSMTATGAVWHWRWSCDGASRHGDCCRLVFPEAELPNKSAERLGKKTAQYSRRGGSGILSIHQAHCAARTVLVSCLDLTSRGMFLFSLFRVYWLFVVFVVSSIAFLVSWFLVPLGLFRLNSVMQNRLLGFSVFGQFCFLEIEVSFVGCMF